MIYIYIKLILFKFKKKKLFCKHDIILIKKIELYILYFNISIFQYFNSKLYSLNYGNFK